MSTLKLEHIKKSFGDVNVINDFDIDIKDGEFVTLLGPSGCGKTTLLRIIAGFERPTSGILSIGGKVMSDDKNFVPPEKREIGMVFQSYAVWPHMNVYDNVAYPLKIKGLNKEEIKQKVDKILEIVHLAKYRDRMPNQLSGGQQQRIALGRALIAQPELLLLDEPLSNLDAKLRDSMRYEIKKISKEIGITVIFVTHDQSEAMTMSDKVVIMNRGVIQQMGTPYEIYHNPTNQFVADFIGNINFLKGKKDGDLIKVLGTDFTLKKSGVEFDDVVLAIRPESVEISNENIYDNQIEATITDIYFLGEHTDVFMKLGDYDIRAITKSQDFIKYKEGDKVYVNFDSILVFEDDNIEHTQILT